MEILAPGGSEQSARAALFAGADAVYLGLKQFSARVGAENFGVEELKATVRLAHLLGAKVYVALNTLIKEEELPAFFESARLAWDAGADALLLQDLFLGRELLRRYPSLTLHLSTQAGCCNRYGAEVAKDFGFSRAVLARETPLSDIEKISSVIETEVFVQGALCTAFSGQCYFSSFAGNHSGNRGMCKQPCRKRYKIDRDGFSEMQYALSLSDLSLGKRIKDLLSAGVTSFKIEGRMRRPEYCAAAVKYYRALLAGRTGEEEFSLLKRAFNRGDYTEGLAFGQTPSLRSPLVQGHIGEEVGRVELRGGKPFTSYRAQKGDAFKILRKGEEVSGAVPKTVSPEGTFLSSQKPLKAGDEVRLTTSAEGSAEALRPVKARKLSVFVRLEAGKRPFASSRNFSFEGEELLPRAERAPLTEEDVASAFRKAGEPLLPEVEVQTDGVFWPKSALNAFRREFYRRLRDALDPPRPPLQKSDLPLPVLRPVKGKERAEIGNAPSAPIRIVKPRDYRKVTPEKGSYLYLPPLFTSADEALIKDVLPEFEGIYAEGYYGIALAKAYGVKLFAGVGMNLTNSVSVAGIKERAERFTLSKELSKEEEDALAAEGAFALTEGDIKLMDLCYCPFGKKCASCDGRELYRMTDEAGRVFPLSRIRLSEGCRFEVYNCAALKRERGLASPLSDGTAEKMRSGEYTRGHYERSLL